MDKTKKATESSTPVQTASPLFDQQTLTLRQTFDLALQHHRAGNLSKAKKIYQQILEREPNQPNALHLLGVIAYQGGENDIALDLIRKALTLKPDFAEAHSNLGLALQELGQLGDALAQFQKAIDIKPDYTEAHYNLGNVLQDMGKLDEAMASYHESLTIKPNNAEAYNNLGNVLGGLGKLEEATTSYHKALEFKNNYPEAHYNLGITLEELGRLDESRASYREALAIRPDYAEAHSNLVFAQQYKMGITLKKLNEISTEWDRQHGAPLRTEWRDHGNTPEPERRLRVGFVSPDLGRHPVGYFVVNLLEHRQSEKIELICYSDRKPDDMTDRLMALSDEWTDVRGISDEALSQRIRSDRIDILIDLAGHTAGNRLLVFARKPAPILVTWAGNVGSTGLSAVDYLISDYQHVPEGSERYYSEKVIRLPDGNVSYEAPDYAPEVGPLPFEQNGFITFGSFNNVAKINDNVLAAWTEILKAVPNARLILKYGNMDAESNRSRILDQFSAHSVEGSRLILEGKSPHSDLLSRYNDIDIALDTFPYCGGLTTCEAIWMGVPVISKLGEISANRTSLSHLTNVGVPELVADELQDYVAKAVELANDVSRLTGLRSGLREQMAKSTLCDGKKFAYDFISAVRHVWKQWCSGGKPNLIL